MKLHSLTLVLFLAACGGDKRTPSGSSSNQSARELAQLNESATKAQVTAAALANMVLGTNGIADRIEAIRTKPIATVAQIRAWRAERDELRRQLQPAMDAAARFALEAHAMEANRREFLEKQDLGFPWSPTQTSATGNSSVGVTHQAFVIEVMAVATLTIGAYRFLKGFGELADHTQRMVYTTANGGEQSRKAVINILRSKGVEISDNASSERVIALFKEQPRDLRRTITSEVEAWNESKFEDADPTVSDAAEGRFQQAKDEVPDIANEGAALGVTQTVSLVQAVTGGVGSVVGGVPGAAADLALTATEMNPTDVVQRHVTVFAAAGEKVGLPTENTSMLPYEAIETIEQAQAGNPAVTPEELKAAASTLIKEVADELRSRFGSTAQLVQKVAIATGSLTSESKPNGTTTQALKLSLPAFQNGEVAEVIVVREGLLPQEVRRHVLGPNNAVVLDSPPLLGTISVDAVPGAREPGGSQVFNVTGHLIRVPSSTRLLCQGINAICSPSVATIYGENSATFAVGVIGRGQVRLVRHDTGESYSLVLNADSVQPDVSNTPKNLDPNLIGTWAYGEGDDTYSWQFNTDGTCVQSTPVGDYDWLWSIENGQLKLFVEDGIPKYMQYKIEGNELYFWADSISDWAVPFVKV